ncbi:Cna B-type domain-containing protein [Listeria aquatica]|uniref:Cna B-type domain-containing protein n=1 Tax=Listeria aquatica TaxID=1494960 RepID=UPI003EF9B5BC
MWKKSTKLLVALVIFGGSFISGTSSFAAEELAYVPKNPGNVYDDFSGNYGLLGVASKFHIFAKNKTILTAHVNGNVATKALEAYNNFGTDIVEGTLPFEVNYIQETNQLIASSEISDTSTRTDKFVVGSEIPVGEADGHPVVNGTRLDHLSVDDLYKEKEGNHYIDFEAEFARLGSVAEQLRQTSAIKNYTAADFPDRNKREIDLTDVKDKTNTVTINLDAAVLTQDTPLTIKNPNDVNLVFNVMHGSNDLAVQSQIHYNDRVNHETENFDDANVVWNFGTELAHLAVQAPFQGTVLAPNASITVTQNLDGSIIGKDVSIQASTNRWDPNPIALPKATEQTLEISGEKVWQDLDNKWDTRPESITVNLLQNGKVYDTQEVRANNDGKWLYHFSGAPKMDANGKAYSYTVDEGNVPEGYVKSVNGTTITNTYQNSTQTSISGKKVWQDFDNQLNTRPDAITIELLQNGEVYQTKQIQAGENGDWTFSFSGLPKYDASGEAYSYTVDEVDVPEGYVESVEGTTITNTYAKKPLKNIQGDVIWKDKNDEYDTRPDNVKVILFQNGKVFRAQEVDADLDSDWDFDFTDVPQFDADGKPYVYTVNEGNVPADYDSSVSGYTITNVLEETVMPEPDDQEDDLPDSRPDGSVDGTTDGDSNRQINENAEGRLVNGFSGYSNERSAVEKITAASPRVTTNSVAVSPQEKTKQLPKTGDADGKRSLLVGILLAGIGVFWNVTAYRRTRKTGY